MLRKLSNFLLAIGLVALAAGPALAMPLTPSSTSTVRAPGAPDSAHPVRAILALLGGAAAVGITIRSDTATLANKFVTRAGAAAGDYKTGVQAAGNDWEARTKEANDSYKQGVQASIARDAFSKGVTGSAAKYQQNAVALGATRYQPGVANAKDAWQRGVQPYLDVLKGLNLPAKGARRSPQNMARSNAVATALGAAKEGK